MVRCVHRGCARQNMPGRTRPISSSSNQASRLAPIIVPTIVTAAASKTAAPEREDCKGDQQHGQQDHARDQRQVDQRAAGDVHEDAVACRGWRRSVRQRRGERERLVAHMLEGRRIERGDRVAGAVVARFIADRGEVERQPAALGEAVDVGVVGHEPVDVGRERVGDGPLHRPGEQGDRSAVRPAGLEHVDRTSDAARFEIDQAVDVRLSGSARNARAPIRPSSSPSLNSRMTGRLGWLLLQDRARLPAASRRRCRRPPPPGRPACCRNAR